MFWLDTELLNIPAHDDALENREVDHVENIISYVFDRSSAVETVTALFRHRLRHCACSTSALQLTVSCQLFMPTIVTMHVLDRYNLLRHGLLLRPNVVALRVIDRSRAVDIVMAVVRVDHHDAACPQPPRCS